MVSIQAYNKLKAHLNLLIKKHQAFKSMIINSGDSTSKMNVPNNISKHNYLINKTDFFYDYKKSELNMVLGGEAISKKFSSNLADDNNSNDNNEHFGFVSLKLFYK